MVSRHLGITQHSSVQWLCPQAFIWWINCKIHFIVHKTAKTILYNNIKTFYSINYSAVYAENVKIFLDFVLQHYPQLCTFSWHYRKWTEDFEKRKCFCNNISKNLTDIWLFFVGYCYTVKEKELYGSGKSPERRTCAEWKIHLYLSSTL